VFTARNRQNAFAKRRREVREAQQADAPPAEPTAVPYDTRNDASDGVVDAPDIAAISLPDLPAAPGVDGWVDPAPVIELEQTIDPTPVAVPEISDETKAKIDAVLNHAITPVVDSAPVEPEPTPEAAAEPAESEPKRGRGRPRPQETIDRDNAVHALLSDADPNEGVSKEVLALMLAEKEQQVYSSLRQLTKEGRAETRYVKPHGYRWFAL
jgi:hypothetical protein